MVSAAKPNHPPAGLQIGRSIVVDIRDTVADIKSTVADNRYQGSKEHPEASLYFSKLESFMKHMYSRANEIMQVRMCVV